MTNQDNNQVLGAVLWLTNELAYADPDMRGSETYKAHHYGNAIALILHHLDPDHDIRWLEDAYKYWKPELTKRLPKQVEDNKIRRT